MFIGLTMILLTMATSLSAGVIALDGSAAVRVYKGSYLFSKVQDNGHSCVYKKNYKKIVLKCEGCGDHSDKWSISSDKVQLKDLTDDGPLWGFPITASSVAITDVIATLQERYDNGSRHSQLFDLARVTLAGNYAIHQGTWHYHNVMELIGEEKIGGGKKAVCLIGCNHDFCPPCATGIWPTKGKTGTHFFKTIAEATKKTHSQGSVSCS